jgi:hypothetical protein
MSTGRDSSLPPVTQNDMAMEVSMYNWELGLVTVPFLGEIVERYLSFVAFLLDVIQNSRELIGRHEPGEHGYWLASRLEKDKGGISRDAKRVG